MSDYNIHVDEQSFPVKTADLSSLDLHNGNSYNIKIDDQYDTMVTKMGLFEETEAISNDIKAPMPGYIVDIMVAAGDVIEEGTPLFVLSAMKMENIILSAGKGVIKSIEVKVDDSVDKGQLIIEIEDEKNINSKSRRNCHKSYENGSKNGN